MKPLRVAVIGGGIAGIAAAHLIQKKHQVTLYESSERLGGHAHSVSVSHHEEGSAAVAMDTAFLVFNERTYPLFMRLLGEWGVESSVISAEMSACFSDSGKDLHYALKRGVSSIFYQRKSLFRPGFYRLFLDLIRFRKRAWADLEKGTLGEQTIGEYLAPYSVLFRENLAIPMAVSIWSLPREQVEGFPARTLLKFFQNHQLLKGKSDECWKTFSGTSRRYIDAFEKGFSGKILLGHPVTRVLRDESGASIHTTSAAPQAHDKVVLATHADVTLSLIENPTEEETRLLGAWKYQDNPTTLHTDSSAVHPDRKLWASWNVRITPERTQPTYYLNRVQSLAAQRDYFLTLGEARIDESKIIRYFNYRHPVFDQRSVETQKHLSGLNGVRNSYFCGSYFGYGFHEDAVRSANEVAKLFECGLS